MSAHRYWRLDNFTGGSGGYISGAEAYLRQTAGGANSVPVAVASSASYSSGPSVLYDGNASTWWATNASGWYVAFDYGSGVTIDPVELFWQNRHDYGIQSPSTASLSYSDTGLTGPWTYVGEFSFGTWSTNGQTQTAPLPPGYLRVSEQHGFAAITPSGLFVPEQHGFAVLTNSGAYVTEQHGYAVLIKSTNSRRRQVMLGSF